VKPCTPQNKIDGLLGIIFVFKAVYKLKYLVISYSLTIGGQAFGTLSVLLTRVLNNN
jgi:hypothetical protein